MGILLIAFAFILTGLIENVFPIKKIFPFTGLLLLVMVTWFLYKTEDKNLDELGFNLKAKHVSLLFLGLIIGVLAFVLAKFLRYIYTGENLDFNSAFEWSQLTLGLYYILPMVAVEEFLFRGYLFKKTIEVSSILLANIVFAGVFMLVHVLDEHVISNLGMIVFLVVTIPVGHLLFATALLRSKTILFPIGLHWGNNWASFHLITDIQKPSSVSFVAEPADFETWASFLLFISIWNGFFLLLTYMIWKWPKRQKLLE